MSGQDNVIEKILKGFIKSCNLLLSVFILFIFIFLFLQVLLRYVFHLPLYWVEELVKFMMIYVSTIGGAVALYREGHPKIIIFYQSIPEKARMYYEVFLRLFMMGFALVFLVAGWKYALSNWWMCTSAMEIPYFWPFLAMPVGGLCIFFILLMDNLNILIYKRSFLNSKGGEEDPTCL